MNGCTTPERCNNLPATEATSEMESSVVSEEPTANDEAWSCPICFMWFDMPVAPPCQHTFCAECLKSVVRAAANRQRRSGNTGPLGPACPLCREAFKPEVVQPSARIFEEMLRATVKCRNGGDCTAQFCPLRWKKHQEECPSATVKCMHNAVGCGWKGPRRDLTSHVECCAYEKIKGLVPRVSASLKQMHTQVHHLEARVMAQNAAVANTRAMLAHQRQPGPVLPAVYALLWRPTDWRRYSCPSPDGVLSNVTLICLAPILFLALSGAGVFGGGDEMRAQERALCFGAVAVLGFVAVLEYNNGAPWHIIKGVAVGDLLLQFTARLVVYCTISALPTWKRLPVLLSLLAPLFYPTIVQAVHRLQVQVKNAHNQAQRAHAQPPLPPVEPLVSSAVKVHGAVINGVVRASCMLLCGRETMLVGEGLGKLGAFVLSAVLGAEKQDAFCDRVWVAMSAGIALDDKDRLKERHDTIFKEMKPPLPSITDRRARGLVAAAGVCLFAKIVSSYRGSLEVIGYSRLLLSILDTAHFRLELHIGRLVMGSLQQTRTNQPPSPGRTQARDLLLSRLFFLWVVIGSTFFVLLVLTS